MNYTFEEMWHDWFEYQKQSVLSGISMKTPATLKHYQNDYTEFFKDTELERMAMNEINSGELEIILIGIFDGKNEKRVKNVICNLDHMFMYALENNKIDVNMFKFVDRSYLLTQTLITNKEKDSLTLDQFVAFMDYVHGREDATPRYMPSYAIELAVLTGMELGEVVALRWSCVRDERIYISEMERRDDFTSKKLIVNKKEVETVGITTQIRSILNRVNEFGSHNDNDFMFCDPTGKRYVEAAIGNAVRRFGKKSLGINNVNISRLREAYIDYLNLY